MGEVVGIEVAQEYSADLFEEFWLMYPRKIARKQAHLAWRQLNRKQRLEALEALVHWRSIWVRRGELEFTPHPTTWIHGERWEDELPQEYEAPRHASHVAAVIPERIERGGVIPDAVKAMLAKLRSR